MKNKHLLILVFLSSFLYSNILYVKDNRCIKDDYYFASSAFHYTYSSDSVDSSSADFISSDLEYGYEFVDGKCQKIQVLQDIKMTFSHYKFMVALTGLLLGFVIFITTLFIFIKKD